VDNIDVDAALSMLELELVPRKMADDFDDVAFRLVRVLGYPLRVGCNHGIPED